MEVIGFKHSPFETQDGKTINGYNIYLIAPLGDKGNGMEAERIYVSADKLLACKYVPKVGDNVNVIYNKYGKPDAIVKI